MASPISSCLLPPAVSARETEDFRIQHQRRDVELFLELRVPFLSRLETEAETREHRRLDLVRIQVNRRIEQRPPHA